MHFFKNALTLCAPIMIAPVMAGIHMWSGADMQGHYVYYDAGASLDWNTCYSVTSEFPPGTGSSVDSVHADQGTDCYLYDNNACDAHTGSDHDRLGVGEGGSYYNLADPQDGWGGRVQAFTCRPPPM